MTSLNFSNFCDVLSTFVTFVTFCERSFVTTWPPTHNKNIITGHIYIYIYSGCHRNRNSQIVPFLIFSEIPSVKNSQNAWAESRGNAPKSGSNFREKQVFSETPLSKNSFSHSTAEKSTEKVDIEAYRLFEKCPFLCLFLVTFFWINSFLRGLLV